MDHPLEHRFMPIFLESVFTNTVLNFNLYLYNRESNRYVLYRSLDTRFTESHRAQLMKNRIQALFISYNDLVAYQTYMENNLEHIIDNPKLKTEEKANIIYQSARNLMESVMAKPNAGVALKRTRKFVKNTVRYILTEKDYFFNIISLTSHDYFTYTHSVNVCVYALSLARRIGIKSPLELSIIGSGALLHDIGKSVIPQEILLKKGPLDEEEWKIIKQHPMNGVHILSKTKTIRKEVANIVKYHHEKLDGSGYPDGLIDKDIPVYAKIACIADIFDALNTNRPYKKAADTFHSLQIMNEQFAGKIDRTLLREFILLFRKDRS